MIEYVLIDRLAWASLGGLLAIVVALLACRFRNLHPGVKSWICRIAMLKMLVSLLLAVNLSVTYRGESATWASPILCWFLVCVWSLGVAVVAYHGHRAYRAAAALRRRAVVAEPLREFGMEVRHAQSLPEPCVVGVFKPTLLLPAGDQVAPAVLQHEIAHVRHLDPLFGGVAWLCSALLWFVPGCGRLVAEHSLWEEVWADLDSRESLRLDPSVQANALLCAVSRVREMPCAALGYRGEARAVARRIEAMFAGRYSKVFAAGILLITAFAAVPLRAQSASPDSAVRFSAMRANAPVATMLH